MILPADDHARRCWYYEWTTQHVSDTENDKKKMISDTDFNRLVSENRGPSEVNSAEKRMG